jgi:hypothetical protein
MPPGPYGVVSTYLLIETHSTAKAAQAIKRTHGVKDVGSPHYIREIVSIDIHFRLNDS